MLFKTDVEPKYSDPLIYRREVPSGVVDGTIRFEPLPLEQIDFAKIWMSETNHKDPKKVIYK